MQIVAIEDLHMIADNLADAQAIFSMENKYRAELRFYLQGNDCLGIHLGRHDTSIQTSELENYLLAHKVELRQQISSQVPRLRQEYKQMLLANQADINWSVVKAS